MSEWTEQRRLKNRENLAKSRTPIECDVCHKMVGKNNMPQHKTMHLRKAMAEQARETVGHQLNRKMAVADQRCPHCFRMFTKHSLYGHIRNMHNIYGGKSGREMPSRQKRKKKVSDKVNGTPKGTAIKFSVEESLPDRLPVPIVPRPLLKPNIGVWRENPNFVILTDSDGDDWICERMNKK